uniref:Uncharacterized protein n=1 Tax=viral metagenome TaxID=1070528 RepID=A0A6C0I2T8_9ZZZZ
MVARSKKLKTFLQVKRTIKRLKKANMNEGIMDTILALLNESKEDFRFKLPATVAEVTFKVSAFRGTIEYVANDSTGKTVPNAISNKIIESMEALLKKRLAGVSGDENKRTTHALLWTKKKFFLENMITYLHYIEDDLLPL